ncbi:hypothetical protein G8759_19975 [Spirosoma aureum]|uniref:PLD phosphodiesterase domain-containing protein n=1 Tax=Spirosoma aureum TaxID=2692134 RepID=A0A6G9AQP8_9BACT|nr:hypothetical protein [Spirosoma aureum]QIP14730.1 hypothetical protein G8759_19975 [Spirosoma aureum]
MATLFSTDDASDYAIPQHRQAGVRETTESHPHTLLGRVSDAVADVFPPIQSGHSYHYATAGLWSSHDLLLHLLRQTGPARIWIATWSMTEDAVRVLVQGLASGLIESLDLLIDARVIRRNASAYAFVQAHADKVRITACHAKVSVLINQNWHISIVGSANYTNNPRIESGVVTEREDVARFHQNWIEAEMKKAKPFGDATPKKRSSQR